MGGATLTLDQISRITTYLMHVAPCGFLAASYHVPVTRVYKSTATGIKYGSRITSDVKRVKADTVDVANAGVLELEYEHVEQIGERKKQGRIESYLEAAGIVWLAALLRLLCLSSTTHI